MELKLQYRLIIALALFGYAVQAQDVSLFNQYNGHYDFLFIGNTLNTTENNNVFAPCTILTSSSTTLYLPQDDVVENAYLYWAGCGKGDFDVTLNGQDIVAERTFEFTSALLGLPYFSAFADVTALVQTTGNGTYALSNLDLTDVIPEYCNNATNFGGWAIVIVYKNPAFPKNQINIYDGLQGVPDLLTISLNNLYVIDNAGAEIGFVAWEGDRLLAYNESLTINGNVLGNTLNPPTNAFNGTNSFTGATNLYNMDLDVYSIQNNIHIGDTSAEIQLTSGQDVVMINVVVTKLNSQLPDATISIDDVSLECDKKTIFANYTVYNSNATSILPAGIAIAAYANGQLVGQTQTSGPIAIGGSESGQIALLIPAGIPGSFDLQLIVDDDGTGHGTVIEFDETNNGSAIIPITFGTAPAYNILPDSISCNEGFGQGTFDFSGYEDLVKTDSSDTVQFFSTLENALANTNPILNAGSYTAAMTPTRIFVRIENGQCFGITSFLLTSRKCPPVVYNYISSNNDGLNDDFYIKGLRDIFLNFRLSIYNRWGRLIWIGGNDTPNWDGNANTGKTVLPGNVTDGTYFYILELNDPEYPKPINGFLFFKK